MFDYEKLHRGRTRRVVDVADVPVRMFDYEKLHRERLEARDARLRAERWRYELASMRHELASLQLDLALIKLRRALNLKYRPDQPRVPAAIPTAGSGRVRVVGRARTGMTVLMSIPPAAPTSSRAEIDLTEEDARGGHTVTGHVGKNHTYLIRELREQQREANRKGERGDGLRVGSFTSLEAANRLVSATLAKDPEAIEKVTRRGHLFATAKARSIRDWI
jgi:hypothetical protein